MARESRVKRAPSSRDLLRRPGGRDNSTRCGDGANFYETNTYLMQRSPALMTNRPFCTVCRCCWRAKKFVVLKKEKENLKPNLGARRPEIEEKKINCLSLRPFICHDSGLNMRGGALTAVAATDLSGNQSSGSAGSDWRFCQNPAVVVIVAIASRTERLHTSELPLLVEPTGESDCRKSSLSPRQAAGGSQPSTYL